MLTNKNKNIAQKFKNKVSQIIPIIELKIFGSCARGSASDESDLDIYIEVEDITLKQRNKIREIAFDVGFEMDRLISTFVVTKEQLEKGAIGANPIIFRIDEEGIRV